MDFGIVLALLTYVGCKIFERKFWKERIPIYWSAFAYSFSFPVLFYSTFKYYVFGSWDYFGGKEGSNLFDLFIANQLLWPVVPFLVIAIVLNNFDPVAIAIACMIIYYIVFSILWIGFSISGS